MLGIGFEVLSVMIALSFNEVTAFSGVESLDRRDIYISYGYMVAGLGIKVHLASDIVGLHSKLRCIVSNSEDLWAEPRLAMPRLQL